MIIPRLTAIVIALIMPLCVHAEDLAQTIARLEDQLGARIGVAIHDSANGDTWTHRPNERFLMNSTVKVLVCAAALSRDDVDLAETLQVHGNEIVGHAPVTRHLSGATMTIADLCLAAVDQSDNGATNILFDRLGGPEQLTAFLRGKTVDGRCDDDRPLFDQFVQETPRFFKIVVARPR